MYVHICQVLSFCALQLNLMVILLVLRLVHQDQRQAFKLILQLQQKTSFQAITQILRRLLIRIQANEATCRQVQRFERIEITVDNATVQVIRLTVVNVFTVVAAIQTDLVDHIAGQVLGTEDQQVKNVVRGGGAVRGRMLVLLLGRLLLGRLMFPLGFRKTMCSFCTDYSFDDTVNAIGKGWTVLSDRTVNEAQVLEQHQLAILIESV